MSDYASAPAFTSKIWGWEWAWQGNMENSPVRLQLLVVSARPGQAGLHHPTHTCGLGQAEPVHSAHWHECGYNIYDLQSQQSCNSLTSVFSSELRINMCSSVVCRPKLDEVCVICKPKSKQVMPVILNNNLCQGLVIDQKPIIIIHNFRDHSIQTNQELASLCIGL